jgi:SAM-dependent methyltransferase
VYHHLEHPAETLQSIHRALRPGGRLAIVDFDRVPGKSSEFVMKHIRDGKAVFLREIQAAGFRLDESPDAPTLRENFFAQFTKDAAAPVNPSPQQPDSGGR